MRTKHLLVRSVLISATSLVAIGASAEARPEIDRGEALVSASKSSEKPVDERLGGVGQAIKRSLRSLDGQSSVAPRSVANDGQVTWNDYRLTFDSDVGGQFANANGEHGTFTVAGNEMRFTYRNSTHNGRIKIFRYISDGVLAIYYDRGSGEKLSRVLLTPEALDNPQARLLAEDLHVADAQLGTTAPGLKRNEEAVAAPPKVDRRADAAHVRAERRAEVARVRAERRAAREAKVAKAQGDAAVARALGGLNQTMKQMAPNNRKRLSQRQGKKENAATKGESKRADRADRKQRARADRTDRKQPAEASANSARPISGDEKCSPDGYVMTYREYSNRWDKSIVRRC